MWYDDRSRPCPLCSMYGTHAHTVQEVERLRRAAADELFKRLECSD